MKDRRNQMSKGFVELRGSFMLDGVWFVKKRPEAGSSLAPTKDGGAKIFSYKKRKGVRLSPEPDAFRLFSLRGY
jgi:hypothetical protein